MTLSRNELARLRKLGDKRGRRESGQFLVEGVRAIRALQSSRHAIRLFIACEEYLTETGRELVRETADGRLARIGRAKFDTLSSATRSQGVLAVAETGSPPPLNFADRRILVLALDRIADPSNLGSLLRSAAAFGVQIVLSADSAEMYSPKVIAASAGYVFTVAHETAPNLAVRLSELKKAHGLAVWGGDPAGQPLSQVNEVPQRLVLVIGNEAFGFMAPVKAQLDRSVALPLARGVDSLSAPVAGGILLYRLKEQQTAQAV